MKSVFPEQKLFEIGSIVKITARYSHHWNDLIGVVVKQPNPDSIIKIYKVLVDNQIVKFLQSELTDVKYDEEA